MSAPAAPAWWDLCPTDKHAHPGGVGVNICGCNDCLILFGGIAPEYLAPESRARLKELRAKQEDVAR